MRRNLLDMQFYGINANVDAKLGACYAQAGKTCSLTYLNINFEVLISLLSIDMNKKLDITSNKISK